MREHKVRDKNGKVVSVLLTPASAIHVHCRECTCWVPGEAEACTATLCPLYPFRPSRRGHGCQKIPPKNRTKHASFGGK